MTESDVSTDWLHLDTNDEKYYNFSNQELLVAHELILKKNETIRYENKMFDKFLERIENKRSANDTNLGSLLVERTSSHTKDAIKKRTRSRTSVVDRSAKITIEQKCEVAEEEIEDYRQEIENVKVEADKIMDSIRVTMEATDKRLAEVSKFQYEFDREVVKGGVNQFTNVVMSEKFVRHFEERLKQRDTLIDKLRLKNSTLIQQKCKLKMQLKQKEEMGEVLQQVDFQQLKIENKQYLDKMEEKNVEIIGLKLMAGRALQELNLFKQKLATSLDDLKKIKLEINTREELICKIEAETVIVNEEKDKAELYNKKLRQQMDDYNVPAVMDFVNCVAEQYELSRKEKILTRKLDIAAITLKIHKNIWKQTKRSH